MRTKKYYETIEQKIIGYESVVNFYERNRDGRIQTKRNLVKIAYEINLELDKDHSKKHFANLRSLYGRIGRFI